VGSALVGPKEFITKARRIRKLFGGGMRQAGILAAAGLIALEEGPSRLHEDHANARLLAEAVATCEGVEIDLPSVQTNIVLFTLKNGGDAPSLVSSLKSQGILCSAIGQHAIRLVTHSDVSREQCEHCASTLARLLKK
jgi:threonine aldolase